MKTFLITYVRKQRKYEHNEDYSKDFLRIIEVKGIGKKNAIRNFYNCTPKDFEKIHTIILKNWENLT